MYIRVYKRAPREKTKRNVHYTYTHAFFSRPLRDEQFRLVSVRASEEKGEGAYTHTCTYTYAVCAQRERGRERKREMCVYIYINFSRTTLPRTGFAARVMNATVSEEREGKRLRGRVSVGIWFEG